MKSATKEDPTKFSFDPDTHRYFLGGKRIPGVSEMLTKIGITRDYKGVDPFYRDRGIACHKAIELYLQGLLDETSLDPAIQHQFDAFLHYWAAHKTEKIVALETPLCDTEGFFAGTPDLVTTKAIYDWKCSKDHDRVADLQGQAYKSLVVTNWESVLKQPIERAIDLPFIVVELHDDGTASEFNYGAEVHEWEAVRTLYDWRTR